MKRLMNRERPNCSEDGALRCLADSNSNLFEENSCGTIMNFDTRLVALMQRNGVGLLAGTDTGEDGSRAGQALHQELELLVQAGLTPAQALRTAT